MLTSWSPQVGQYEVDGMTAIGKAKGKAIVSYQAPKGGPDIMNSYIPKAHAKDAVYAVETNDMAARAARLQRVHSEDKGAKVRGRLSVSSYLQAVLTCLSGLCRSTVSTTLARFTDGRHRQARGGATPHYWAQRPFRHRQETQTCRQFPRVHHFPSLSGGVYEWQRQLATR